MRYFTYPWKQGEFEQLVQESYSCPCNKDERFVGGLLLPFLGGVLVGGLFLPRPNQPLPPYGPVYPPVGVPYVQPVPYVNEVPTYSVPVNNKVK